MTTIVRYEWVNLHNWTDEVDRVTSSTRLIGRFEEVLFEQFELTRAQVASPGFHHVETYEPTGSLFNSGHTDVDYDGESWTGSIIYGGPSVPNDVDYAIYELARGGIHDWFRGVDVIGERYLEAIDDHYEGRT